MNMGSLILRIIMTEIHNSLDEQDDAKEESTVHLIVALDLLFIMKSKRKFRMSLLSQENLLELRLEIFLQPARCSAKYGGKQSNIARVKFMILKDLNHIVITGFALYSLA
ncbi:hypothetical protein H5410_061941 [Solanum commersonii]|uniref:Uncharacterized protein n=1 Tax=Solanum commersonii TaxID=4109 RepID=A0A9J5WA20_SOLCO|nr:hypothetical protein H5410_061941 [Solanum commersonii]